MKESKRFSGTEGEEFAARFLLKKGFVIFVRNWYFPGGEIDIVAGKEDFLVFVEVKAWNALGEGELEYGINRKKQNTLIKGAKAYLQRFQRHKNKFIRFDIVFITDNYNKVVHIENAFEEV